MPILIVDGSALWARSYYAAMSDSGKVNDAVRLAVNSILLLLDPETNKIGAPIDRTLFAWDGQQNKAKGRDEKPAIYHEAKDVLKDVLSYLIGTEHVESDTVEADDLVATAVAQTDADDIIYVVSSDKDLMQLVGGNCHYYSLAEKAVLMPSFITHKFHGIKHPQQIAIELAIVGDPVDNIPGVQGYGKKKCKKLFEAVKPSMDFEAALDTIVRQLPPQQEEEFNASFERTLLKRNIPGVPAPAPLKLQTPAEIKILDMPLIEHYYRNVWNAYR